jgi:hypothetical protein
LIGSVLSVEKTYETTNNLNMRKGPCDTYALVVKIPKGESISRATIPPWRDEVVDCGFTWWTVEYDGKRGFVASKFLREQKTKPKSPTPKVSTSDSKKDLQADANEIEKQVKAFAEDLNKELVTLRTSRLEEAQKTDPKATVPVVTFTLSKGKDSLSRTPEEQAKLVSDGSSWVCWSGHMTDKARHVLMKVDGKVDWDPKKALGKDFEDYKKKWNSLMTTHGLKNYKGGDGYAPGDEFHLELPDSKMAKDDERAKKCLDEYARISREEGGKKNAKFDKQYAALLKPYFEKYEKKK